MTFGSLLADAQERLTKRTAKVLSPGRSAGLGTIEYIAGIAIAVVLILGIAVVVSGADLGSMAQRAICTVKTMADCPATDAAGKTPLERATSGRYVAMGDSFSSGEGAGDYQDGTDTSDDACHRSNNAYSQVIGHTNTFEGGVSFVACSGAVFTNIGGPNPGNNENPQTQALGEDVSLVTVSIGGNDLKFGDVVGACVWNGQRGVPVMATCQETYAGYIDEQLGDDGQTGSLYATLVAQYKALKAQAPNARIVVVGYPPLFSETPGDNLGVLLFEEDQIWMNDVAQRFNLVMARAAAAAGVEFVDPTAAFQGHGIGDDDQYFNDIKPAWGWPPVSPESFHPNAAGQAAYAQAVQQQLRQPK